MASKITIETIESDEGDETGQSVRDWYIKREGQTILISQNEQSYHSLYLTVDDVDAFTHQLKLIKDVM